MENLLKEIAACQLCTDLPHGPRPIVSASPTSKIAIIGQAPGSKVHASGIPWDDKSGDNLRQWMGIDKATFYNPNSIALIPMGFCYPGRGKSGDLPPRKICAPTWHQRLWAAMDSVSLILLVGSYAQNDYLLQNPYKTLTQTVQHYYDFLPRYFVLPHPSPRNNIWQAKNLWFQQEVIPALQSYIAELKL